MSLVLDRLCGERSTICKLLARTSLRLVRFSRCAMQSPRSRPGTASLSNSWSGCRITYGHPPNVPCVTRACHSKSLGRRKEWVNFVLAQLKNRSTAVTLFSEGAALTSRIQPFEECGSREIHCVYWLAAHGER